MVNKKTVIFYFSQSGNSLYVAKRIGEALKNTVLISIPDSYNNNKFDYYEYEKVGFVVPLYFMGMPKMVKEFISKVKISKESYKFSIVTRAITRGRVLYDIDKIFREKQGNLNYGEYMLFPDSYIKWAEADSEKKCNEKFAKSEASFEEINKRILNEENYIEEEGKVLKITSLVVYSVWKNRTKKLGKKFKVNEGCIKCGICEKTCPAKNIKLEEGKPKWGNKCEDCMACIQHCPKKAIYLNLKTINKKRYIHPNIKLEELLRL